MREWSISREGPLSLCIAADARLTTPDYLDDQIWELVLVGGDPPALSIQTTYGLRARSMRIFPGFGWGETVVVHPDNFFSPPVVRTFLPNYLRISCSPFEGLDVDAEYWVPDSKRLAGRFTYSNQGVETQNALLRLHALLLPGENPQVMDEQVFQGATVLSGKTGSIEPVVFLSGGAVREQTTFPSLMVSGRLASGEQKSWVWVHAGQESHANSFEAARELLTKSWDAEIARVEMAGSSIVDIETGDADWDAALALAQKDALMGYVGPTRHLSNASLILTRRPDRGYSPRGDGSDVHEHWAGHSVAHAYTNILQVLPIAPDLAKGIIRNFIMAGRVDGGMDGSPGLGGQRNGMLAIPLLATLAWKIYLHTEDHAFLESVFGLLQVFIDVWFESNHDRDGDGHPEWVNTAQSGFDDIPSFVRWRQWGQGLDISLAETPDLASYLFRECQALKAMAEVLNHTDRIPEFEARISGIRESVEAAWSERASVYQHKDRDLHVSPRGLRLGRRRGAFNKQIERSFDPPVRVLVRSTGEEGLSHAVKVFIHGRGRRGRKRIEKLTERNFQWFWDFGTATSEKHYTEIERIEVAGLSKEFETELRVADFTDQDQTLLLPLWAGIPASDRAGLLVRKTLCDEKRFWRPFGIPACSAKAKAYAEGPAEGAGGVWMFWNVLLGEGLLRYGYRKEAVALLERLMANVIHSLKADKAFRESYHAEQAAGFGDRHHQWGLAPVSLFLETLGVRLISPRKVWLRPSNPFHRPVTIRWRGLKIECFEMHTVVTFPNGQRVKIEGDEPQFVEQG
jgi:hypothetical protein